MTAQGTWAEAFLDIGEDYQAWFENDTFIVYENKSEKENEFFGATMIDDTIEYLKSLLL